MEASKQSICLKKGKCHLPADSQLCFTSWSSSILYQDVFIDVTAPICHNLTSAAVCFGLPLFRYFAFPVIIKCLFFFGTFLKPSPVSLAFWHSNICCPPSLSQNSWHFAADTPLSFALPSKRLNPISRSYACREAFFFSLSLSHLQVNVPLSQNVHKSSISWSVLMPGGVAQSPTIHIVCMLSSTLKNNNCVCISKSTHMTFFPFLCSCLDSDIFGRLMCWQG